MNATPYPTDLTDAEGDLIKNVIPPPKPGGRHRARDMRAVVNAIFSVVDGGIQWRMLPPAYPQWPSVYWYCSQWRDSGAWQRLHDTLRAQVRQQAGRHKPPTAGCVSDPAGARLLFARRGGAGKKLRRLWVDGGYRGQLVAWVSDHRRCVLRVTLRPEGAKGFVRLPRRWVVERPLAWLNQSRRLSKDYERLPKSSEARIYLSMTRLMLRRLTAA